MSALRRRADNDKSTSSLRRGNATARQRVSATARQRVNVPTRWLMPQQRLDAAARRCNNTAAQYGISAIRHFGNGPLRQCGLRQRRLRSPHPTHPACRTASAPIRRGNSHAAHTHSHIVHAHSRIPYRMGHAHSHILPYRMDQTAHPPGSTGRGYMSPCRMDRTNAHVRKCLNGASLQRFGFYMSENARMGPVFPSRLIATTTSGFRKPRSKL